MLALATFSIPIVGSFIALAANRISAFVRNALAVLFALATFACALALIPLAGEARPLTLGPFLLPGLNLNFVVDGLGVYVAVTSSFIGLLIVLYSLEYMKEYEHQGEYYFLVVLFLGAMMGLVLSANLLLVYIFWEITAICSWRLIGFYRKREHLRNADIALLITVSGSFFMLAGLEMIWHQAGTLDLAALRGHPVSDLALTCLFAGILAKSAQVPLQVWLPGAGVAPSTVTALLHAAVLVVIGVFAFARVMVGTLGLPPTWQLVTSALAVLTLLVAGAAALVEHDAKRILAYSTIAQLAYVLLGLASMTSLGIAGALVFLLAHSLTKAGLFLCVGIIEHRTHTRDIRELGGLIKRMPVTAVAFILCALTIVGLPPTAGFFGKFMIILGVVQSGGVVWAILAVVGALISLLYALRLFNGLFLGQERWPEITEGTPIMLAVVGTFAGLSLVLGLAAAPLLTVVNGVVSQMLR
ncbi:MAG: NADH-quinone oxidoreductase subunit L [Anaerolineales bacterium]|jgi:NADH:ubiquinone oxidoreductase subunit 5 (subunit L)/multisubunit Na+/H+ antiporter MnhA subunit